MKYHANIMVQNIERFITLISKKTFLFIFFVLLIFPNLAVADILFNGKSIAQEIISEKYQSVLKKAKSGEARSQALLGFSYANSFNFSDLDQELDYKKACKWLSLAADQGVAEANYGYGQLLFFGKGVDQNKKKGVYFIERAAEDGMQNAQRFLIKVYADIKVGGESYPDDDRLVYWTKILAENGDKVSQINMSNYYVKGMGVSRNNKKAFEWLDKAVQQDDPYAQYQMGEFYENGVGIEKSLVKAYMMYDLGGSAGMEKKEALAKEMTAEQVKEGKALSRKWQEDRKSFRLTY